MAVHLRFHYVQTSRVHFALNELLHSHHIYSGQPGKPAISVCFVVGPSLNKTKFLTQGNGCCLRRADVHDKVGVTSLFAEIESLPCQF